MPTEQIWDIDRGHGPLIATAIHAGHALRPEVASRVALSPPKRLREEDPHTDVLTRVADTRVVVRQSRFEVDLNRRPAKAVYLESDDAWGLNVWTERPPEDVVERSLQRHREFYAAMRALLDDVVAAYGRFVVYDIHSYNFRRDGPDAAPQDEKFNPEVNVGTGTMDRERWTPVVDGFIHALRRARIDGHRLDVRENVKFRGGHFPRWVHENYPARGCVLAIEFKKTFMDEWSGEVDPDALRSLRDALAGTVPVVLEALEEVAEAARAA